MHVHVLVMGSSEAGSGRVVAGRGGRPDAAGGCREMSSEMLSGMLSGALALHAPALANRRPPWFTARGRTPRLGHVKIHTVNDACLRGSQCPAPPPRRWMILCLATPIRPRRARSPTLPLAITVTLTGETHLASTGSRPPGRRDPTPVDHADHRTRPSTYQHAGLIALATSTPSCASHYRRQHALLT